jgi:hypothetical protein
MIKLFKKIIERLKFLKSRIDEPIMRDVLINKLIRKYNFKTYLEIGIDNGNNFNRINCLYKDSVDPAEKNYNHANPKYKVTSDVFFKSVANEYFKYDIIFIDGLHHYEQVNRDIENSLKHLNEGGFIVLHDCNPKKEIHQKVPRESKLWNGDVWKSVVHFRSTNNEYGCLTIDSDQGLGIISKKIKPYKIKFEHQLNYQSLEKNRNELLGLINVNDFKKKFFD